MKLIQHKLFLIGPLAALTACSSARHGGRPAVTSQSAEARTARDLGGDTWGIACLSVASARERPDHKSEMATQILMGGVVRAWKQAGRWFFIEADDGYRAWLETESFFPCTKAEVETWTASPLLIVTAFEDCIREQPLPDAQPVSDVVMDCLVRKTGEDGDWFQVELPDHRTGFLPRRSATDFARWKQSRRATSENIERAAKQFLGRPYLWGGNSPKGLDCSGLTKLVFFSTASN